MGWPLLHMLRLSMRSIDTDNFAAFQLWSHHLIGSLQNFLTICESDQDPTYIETDRYGIYFLHKLNRYIYTYTSVYLYLYIIYIYIHIYDHDSDGSHTLNRAWQRDDTRLRRYPSEKNHLQHIKDNHHIISYFLEIAIFWEIPGNNNLNKPFKGPQGIHCPHQAPQDGTVADWRVTKVEKSLKSR